MTGEVGDGGLDLDSAREVARLTGLPSPAATRAESGQLNRVRQVVELLGMVQCRPGSDRTPAVMDGCSDSFAEVPGAAGRGARSAVGMAEPPSDIDVEIEAVVRVAA